MTPDKRVIDLLESTYGNLKGADKLETLLLCTKDYVEYIQETPEFVAIVKGLEDEKDKWLTELENLEEKALKELETAEKFILPFVKEKPNETDGRSFMFDVTGLKMYKEGKTDMSGLKSENIENNFLFGIVKNLPQADKDKILERYADKNPEYQDEHGNDFSFSKSRKKLQEYLEDYGNKRKTEVWGCWDFLRLIPKVIPALHNHDTIPPFAENSSYLDHGLFEEYMRLIFIIQNGEAMRDRQLVKEGETIEEYKRYAARVKTHLLKKISELEEKVALPITKIKTIAIPIKDARLDEQNYLLEINNGGKIISFKSKKKGAGLEKETKQFKILSYLWDFRWELKDGRVLKRGDLTSLNNLVNGSGSESIQAAYKHTQRLNNRFQEEGIAIEIKGENEKYRLIINKA